MKLYVIVCIALLIVSFSSVYSQDKTYKIGPDDILSLVIFAGGEQQLKVKLTVSSGGMINIPYLGSVDVEGLTIPQLENRIREPLSKEYFVKPDVVINILEYHSLRYFISGPVKTPGLYIMRSETTLIELIAKAGGTLPERGNLAYILRAAIKDLDSGKDLDTIISGNKLFRKVDLRKLLDQGNMEDNIVLKSGDVVFIPPKKKLDLAASMIYVGGKVEKPDFYEYQPGLTVLNACIMAGGFDRFAAPNRTRIIRNNNGKDKVIVINLEKVMKGKIPDLKLKPGDRVHVPKTWL